MLGAFLFSGDDVYKSRRVLSGGERSRLELLKLLMSPVNLLILDEPTNHLDLASKDVLRRALQDFTGTVIFVSHDSNFTHELADRIIELIPADDHGPSAVRNFPGDYDYYLWKIRQEHTSGAAGEDSRSEPASTTDGEASAGGEPVSEPVDYAEQKRRRRRREKLAKREAEVLAAMEQHEARIARLQEQLADPEVYADGEKARSVNSRLERTRQELDSLSAEWEEIESELAELTE
jgi:ATP-binding cassette subfamily F protein 3